MLPHSASDRGGPMETSLFVINSCSYLGLKGDRRLARKWYPTLRKAGNALRNGRLRRPHRDSAGLAGRLETAPRLGISDRRVTEVNLVAARALSDLASLSGDLNKAGESAGFRDAGAKILKARTSV